MFWRRLRDWIVLILGSIVVFLVLGELTMRAYLSTRTFYDVEMSRYGLTLKVESPNPLIGHVHRPGSKAELMNVQVEINSDGFRDAEYPLEKGDVWRVVVLGDSLTFGWGVEREQTFEYLLEQALNRDRPTEMINLGTGNYNTVQEVNLFLEKGLAYEPDQVVLFFFINDAEPVPKRSSMAWAGHFRILTFYWSRLKALLAQVEPQATFEEYYSALYAPDAAGWRASQAAFLQLRDVCRERGIVFQVVILPELHNLVDYTFAEEHELLTNFLAKHEIPVLDLAPAFSDQTEPMSLWVSFDDAHPNAAAHRRIAEASRSFVAQRSMESERPR